MVLNTEGIACVYWIHLPDQTDIATQGYIGVSKNPAKRWKDHLRDAKGGYHANPYLAKVFLKYHEKLIFDVVFGGTKDQCWDLEKELRPTSSIGWNIMAGGKFGNISEDGIRRIKEARAARKGQPIPLTTKLKRYNTKHNTKLKMSEYLDVLAIEKGEAPPSKADWEIFNVLDPTFFPNANALAEYLSCTPYEAILKCENPDSAYYFVKDLKEFKNL
jgi:hypothetical protein